jgi:hypothetical protein
VLTRKEFHRHLINNDCEIRPSDGINRTANQIEIVNRKTGAYFWISTPINDDIVPKKVIEQTCTRLGIPLPLKYD